MKFHERFNININIEESKKRFVNRVYNEIFEYYENMPYLIATVLGKKFNSFDNYVSKYLSDDFYETLEVLEGVISLLKNSSLARNIETKMLNIFNRSECDLGITWNDGKFIPTGAKFLDDKLVNENLNWLKDKKYISVFEPFEKGLSHFLHSIKREELLADVITEMYESLEALSKIITSRENKDLSANKDLFIKEIDASDEYKILLKQYIEYANKFRHAVKQGKNKPKLIRNEVESFIYLTGIFIRLAIS